MGVALIKWALSDRMSIYQARDTELIPSSLIQIYYLHFTYTFIYYIYLFYIISICLYTHLFCVIHNYMYIYISFTFWILSAAEWSLNTATYSFPADCCDLASLVALSMQTIKHPDTLGSNVPEWPVFSTFKIFFIHATTSCDDGLHGLSKLMQPDFIYSSKLRCSGVEPLVNGVKCFVRVSILSKFYNRHNR